MFQPAFYTFLMQFGWLNLVIWRNIMWLLCGFGDNYRVVNFKLADLRAMILLIWLCRRYYAYCLLYEKSQFLANSQMIEFKKNHIKYFIKKTNSWDFFFAKISNKTSKIRKFLPLNSWLTLKTTSKIRENLQWFPH